MKVGHLISPLVCSIVLGLPLSVMADTRAVSREKHESAGVVGGLVIGALLGGPPGAVASAAFGGWVGTQLAGARNSEYLQAQLDEAREQLLALQDQNARLRGEQVLAQKELDTNNLVASTDSTATLSRGCCRDTELVLHFRSGSSELERHYRRDLTDFVRTVGNIPGAVVELTGHADRRGTAAENLGLSQRRLQAVEEVLREMGLTGVVVETTALGSGNPVSREDSVESNFFDRRVELRIRNSKGELLSSTR